MSTPLRMLADLRPAGGTAPRAAHHSQPEGPRTGRRAVMVERRAVNGTPQPFCTEIWNGDRMAALGGNGSGKSAFLRLLGGKLVTGTMLAVIHGRPAAADDFAALGSSSK